MSEKAKELSPRGSLDSGKGASMEESREPSPIDEESLQKKRSSSGEKRGSKMKFAIPPERKNNDGKSDKNQFDPSEYEKPTAVVFHKTDDLSQGQGLGYKPNMAVPQHGPGVTQEIEQLYGPCTLLKEFQYATWAESIVPIKNHNVLQGINELVSLLMKLASTGGEGLTHDEAFPAVSFLSNIRNDLGEYPPNVLALLEHIDYLTHEDGTPPADPKFVHIPRDPC